MLGCRSPMSVLLASGRYIIVIVIVRASNHMYRHAKTRLRDLSGPHLKSVPTDPATRVPGGKRTPD